MKFTAVALVLGIGAAAIAGCSTSSPGPSSSFSDRTASHAGRLDKGKAPSPSVKAPSPWLNYYPPDKTATLTLAIAPDAAGAGYLVNGKPSRSQQFMVGPGWQVTIHAVNGTARPLTLAVMNHGHQVLAKTRQLAGNAHQALTWRVTTPGSYALVWYAVRSSQGLAGMAVSVAKGRIPALVQAG
ncbi:MAG: hypothetical protein M1272_06500 [Firmicutes bacterium]|nr:hypothetical protein [Bacillota bacterium]